MIAKAWRGGTYGIRVRRPNARKHFDRSWSHIDVEIDDKFHRFPLSGTFWTTCPEFRGAVIPGWLRRNGLIPWPRGCPPQVELTPLGGNRFRLQLALANR